MRRRVALAAAACLALPAGEAAARVPSCPGVGAKQTLVREPGQLESVAFDQAGRLVYTSNSGRWVRGLDTPSAAPRTIAAGIESPGGLVPMPDGSMLVGSGNGAGGLLAPSLGLARLVQLDLATGAKQTYARGLSMTNGVVRAPDGTIFASDDLANSLDRIEPDGRVRRGWYRRTNTNGLAVSADGKTLFANQSFGATRVIAIDIASGASRTYARPPASMSWALFDDLDIDAAGRLYVAVYLAGEVWRIETDGSICALARGFITPAGISVGKDGAGFSSHAVYVTTHTGSLIAIPAAIPAT